jgi:SAM-dependent methyltransferase
MSTVKTGMRSDPPTVVVTPPKEEPENIVITPPVGRAFGKQTIEVEDGGEISEDFVRAILEDAPTDEEMKYEKCWALDAYRSYSPGEHLVDSFLEAVGPVRKGTTIIDWGCGTGRAGLKLYEAGFDVTLVDFAKNCLDPDIAELAKDNDRLRFFQQDLTKKCDLKAQFGFNTDVMEHIPEDDVDTVLGNILSCSEKVFFQISTQPDGFGEHPEIDDDLHLTVHGYFWWLKKFLDHATVVLRSQDNRNTVVFYVTGYGEHNLDFANAKVNIPPEKSIANIIENSKLGLQQVTPHRQQDIEIMMMCRNNDDVWRPIYPRFQRRNHTEA